MTRPCWNEHTLIDHAEHLDDTVARLKAAGLHIISIDADNGVVEGSIEGGQLAAIDLLQFLRNCPPNMREAVALTWRGAARVADVSNLIAQDLTGSPQNLNIAFSHKTKASTANPWRLGMYPVLHVDRQTLSDRSAAGAAST